MQSGLKKGLTKCLIGIHLLSEQAICGIVTKMCINFHITNAKTSHRC